MEARDIMEAKAHGTIRDESLVGQLVEKWSSAGMLKGIGDDYTKKAFSVMLENQLDDMHRHMPAHLRGKGLTEDTLSQNAGEYTKYIFPVLRRVFPNLIANEIVSVQPITGVVGAIFYFEYKHGKSKGQTVAGSNLIQNFDHEYSSEKITGETVAVPDGVAFGGAGAALTAIFQYSPVRPLDTANGVSVLIEDTDADGTVIQSATDDGSGGFTGDTTAGTMNYATGQLTGFLFTAAPAAGAGRTIKVTYSYEMEANKQIPDVYLDIGFEAIKAKSRKLKARWSSEAADDLRSMHGIDADTEIVSGLSQEISLELDRGIIEELYTASAGITNTFDFTVPAGLNETDHIRAVLTRMSNVSFQISKQSRRAPANWYITSPEVSARLVQLQTHQDFRPVFVSNPENPLGPADNTVVPQSYGPITSHYGIQRLGPMANKWLGYQDPYFRFNQIMLGLRGNGYLDAGFVYSPYVPLRVSATLQDPEDDTSRKGLSTRYATKLLRSEWYGRVTITGGL